MTTSESINEIATALAKAQGEMSGATKDSANPFFKSKYADLASVWEACRAALSKNGLAVIQSPSVSEGRVTMETMLVHTSGQWIRNLLSCEVKDDSPQVIGSATTYLRRYALQSLVGVAPEDDDAEAAQGRGNGKQQQSTAQAQAQSAMPKGFDNWLSDLESVVMEGTAALEKAWKGSKPEYRQHLTSTNKARWEDMKRVAAAAPVLESEIA